VNCSTGYVTFSIVAKGPGSLELLTDGVIRLRAWERRDQELLDRARDDEYVALIERLDVAEKTEHELAIEDTATGEAVGGVGFAVRHVPGLAELGYWIIDERRGEGIATRAVRLLAAWALTEGGIERLQATVEPWNAASQRVLEKAAFEREGLLRSYARYGDEPRRDVYLYARLA
jgi:ribosomal-protein-alanine N-acetyltransferase